jgi:hypothetical protein
MNPQPASVDTGTMSPAPLYFNINDNKYDKSSNKSLKKVLMIYRYQAATAYTEIDSLFAYAVSSKSLFIKDGFGKSATLSFQRFVVSVVKKNNYLVLIGPDQPKLEKLAVLLAEKL